MGVMLYDADRIEGAASSMDEQDLYQAQLDVFLDPNDPEVEAQAKAQGIPHHWIESAKHSPVYKMAMEWKIAFPLHPEFRTLPMVWYIPPLSPVQSAIENGLVGERGLIPKVDELRIPIRYLANLLTAGKEEPIIKALETMIAMRGYMRNKHVPHAQANAVDLASVGLKEAQVEEMYRILALAHYDDRFVIPSTHAALTEEVMGERSNCGFSFGSGCSSSSLFSSSSSTPIHFYGMGDKAAKRSE